jgi:RNA polymerase sigma factor (sigma-70 family)
MLSRSSAFVSRTVSRNVRDVQSDSQLAIAAASGDRDALADIYDRYANTLYELCRVILNDPHEASDALQDTFVIAATRLSGLRDPDRLKPWLCAIARHEAIRRSSKRARNRPAHDDALDIPVMDESTTGLVADDAANLVWEAAEALTERERAVLVLNVRQGLEGAELAAAAGMPGPATSVLLSRAKTQLASAVRCTLLIRNGRDACPELAQIVPRKHAAIDGLIRKRVARHATSCAICATTWNKTPEALGVLAAAPLVGAPVALRHKVLNDPRLISFSAPLGTGNWQHDGFPPKEVVDNERRRIVAWFAAALVTIVVVVGIVISADYDGPRLAAPGARTTTTDPSEVEEFAPWPTDPKTGQTVTTKKGATTTTAKKPTTTTTARPAGGGAGTTQPPEPTTTTEPPFSISAGMRENVIECGNSGHVTATTNKPANGVLVLTWTSPDGRTTSGSNMDQTGPNTWVGTAGPMSQGGTWKWSVSTFPSSGVRSDHTVSVICPQ